MTVPHSTSRGGDSLVPKACQVSSKILITGTNRRNLSSSAQLSAMPFCFLRDLQEYHHPSLEWVSETLAVTAAVCAAHGSVDSPSADGSHGLNPFPSFARSPVALSLPLAA